MGLSLAERLMRVGMPAEQAKLLSEAIGGGFGVAWGNISGKPTEFPASAASVNAAVAAKAEIAALTEDSSAADVVAALQA